MQRDQELEARIRDMYEVFNTGNVSIVDDLLSSEGDILGIGTDPREWWSGSGAVRSAFLSQVPEMHASGIRFSSRKLQAFSEGSVGWFADEPAMALPDGSEVPARITGVWRQENGTWKLLQFHFSFGLLNEDALGEELTI